MSTAGVEYSIVCGDGTELTAPNLLPLAWKWAEHENGAAWAGMTRRQRIDSTTDALAELRRAYGQEDE